MKVNLFNIDLLRKPKLKKGISFIAMGTLLFILGACSIKKPKEEFFKKNYISTFREVNNKLLTIPLRVNVNIEDVDLIKILKNKLDFTENDILNDKHLQSIIYKIQNIIDKGNCSYNDISNEKEKCIELYYHDGENLRKIGSFYNVSSFHKQAEYIEYLEDNTIKTEHYTNFFDKSLAKTFRYSTSDGNLQTEITKNTNVNEKSIEILFNNYYMSVKNIENKFILEITTSKENPINVNITEEEYNELYNLMNSYYEIEDSRGFISDNRDVLIKYLAKFHQIIDKQEYHSMLCTIYNIAENTESYSKSM